MLSSPSQLKGRSAPRFPRETMAGLLANLRLRTRFFLSMILVIVFLTGVALLVVRNTVQERARQELSISAHNSLGFLTYSSISARH